MVDHGATSARISGFGAVAVQERREIRPDQSTTYELVAAGPGGTAAASATVIVVSPPPAVAPPQPPRRSLLDRIEQLSDAYFDYDRNDLREDARAALAKDAETLRSIFAEFPGVVIVLEGHYDEWGSAEYNPGPGDRLGGRIPGGARDFSGAAAEHQLRKGTAAVHGLHRGMPAEESAGPFAAPPAGTD